MRALASGRVDVIDIVTEREQLALDSCLRKLVTYRPTQSGRSLFILFSVSCDWPGNCAQTWSQNAASSRRRPTFQPQRDGLRRLRHLQYDRSIAECPSHTLKRHLQSSAQFDPSFNGSPRGPSKEGQDGAPFRNGKAQISEQSCFCL